ncbi:hypothetical protein FB1_14950 [Flavobacterium branchiophilum NBRC 15030 = ATCC 35035]|uniref:Uncharacterized protein n=1 Tax=Flavobacterium branchiophilum TaxID=55197 RepID=A0A543G147_9FLAO|nr:hypothetical protein BC670_0644 [Flavobacterium branchiophilum]GEM55274.1 hypothetical protein FB1_14950 [Flavobacterium branchiophilum NBRC 15030 = ATCC 35035]
MQKPVIHLQIGSLIQKFSIEVRPSTEKTHEDLSRLLHEASHQIEESVLAALIAALNTAIESYETTLVVDGTQKKEFCQSEHHSDS